ncbi:hypothetical protein [Stygiolobus caldivivus]|uniref:Zinc-ribbon domain-containing protein n=1 Tax=Stygiolobus caldivivus TaxID=2824673 RepID=A0A8D5U6P3_9CREN|nr:hypothetical protein [Stygiolobus caldivivus]BCU69834.1 hypothetical protein KN1_11310 [Stygiolobus caldivivus]
MVKVCPRCGTINDDLSTVCVRCGYQFPPLSYNPYTPPFGKKKSKAPIIAALVLVILIASVGGYLYYSGFLYQKGVSAPAVPSYVLPNSLDAYNALTDALGNNYRVTLLNGTSGSGFLVFGTVNDPTTFINYSYLYYIEKGDFVKVFPPGSKEYLPYDLAVLRLVPAKYHVATAVLMNTTGLHYTGGNYTVMLIGTFSHGSSVYIPDYPADGFTVMMFITPPKTPVNESTNYTFEGLNVGMEGWHVKLTGEIYYPYSTTPYIVVQWEPYWHEANDSWTTGEFNVWVVNPSPNGTVSESNINMLVGGGGNGSITGLKPGDLIEVEANYDGYDNTLYAKAVDLNTSSVITLKLPLYSNFTVPKPGYYWTEVNAGTGNSYWNWGIVYLSVFNNVYVNIERE